MGGREGGREGGKEKRGGEGKRGMGKDRRRRGGDKMGKRELGRADEKSDSGLAGGV